MILKANDLYGLDEALSDLANKELEISTALKIKRNLTNVADELRPINDIRTDLINKYKGDKVEGDRVEIKAEKQQEFYEKHNELMNQEVEIKLDKIKLSELKGIKIKPKTLAALDVLLAEEGGKDE